MLIFHRLTYYIKKIDKDDNTINTSFNNINIFEYRVYKICIGWKWLSLNNKKNNIILSRVAYEPNKFYNKLTHTYEYRYKVLEIDIYEYYLYCSDYMYTLDNTPSYIITDQLKENLNYQFKYIGL